MDLDHTLVALADDTRRRILQRLAAGEARVTEVAAPFAISLNSVSKHIRLLERAGLVRRRVAGRDHFLSLDPKPMDEIAAWIARERAAWEARLDRLEAALRAEDAIAAAKKSSSRKPKPRRKP
jgi:DNA-binding transcriptional ArsR family regulator